jgi:hypothetical protein
MVSSPSTRLCQEKVDMNRIIRTLTVAGLGVFAAVSVGAGPAMAATGAKQSPVKPTSPSAASRTRILDVYPNRVSCEIAGRLGERVGDWDDYDCDRTFGGYALRISFDSWNDWNDWDNNDWHGPWGFHGHGGHGGIGGVFHGGHGGHGGIGGGHRGHRGHNGVGAVPGNPSDIPGIGTHSPS